VAANAPGAAVAQRFIARHCVACHGPTKPRGDLRLDVLRGDMAQERETWMNVRRVLLDGEMPPRERERPAVGEVQEVLRWLEASHAGAPSRTPSRRLNRFEFNNALNALLGIDEDFTPFLPEDAQVHGFDTDAQALAITGPALAEYLRTALLAVQYALDDAPPAEAKAWQLVPVIEAGGFRKIRPHELQDKQKKFKEDSYIFMRGDTIVLRPRFMQYQNPMVLSVPLPSSLDSPSAAPPDRMRLTFTVQATIPQGRSAPYLIVRINGQPLGRIPVAATDAPQEYSFVFRKSHLDRQIGAVLQELVLEVMCGYEPGNFSGDFKQEKDRMWANLRKENAKPDENTVREHTLKLLNSYPSLSVSTASLAAAPYPAAANPLHGLNLATVRKDEDRSSIKKLLGTFLTYAFRRPAEAAEVAQYLGMYDHELAKRGSSRQALASCLGAVLCSPSFLYLIPEADRPELRDYDLAERLAAFLWTSIPDRELFDLAAAGKLRDPAILDAQVQRMLGDDKARRFFDRFATQWLRTARLHGNHSSSRRDYANPDNEYLRRSLAGEPAAYFTAVVRDNLSATSFIDSKFAVVNERTAPLYGLTDVLGAEFRRVELPADSRRGGVMTLASVMAATDRGLYLPIYRGAWIREAMFNKRLPNPPSDVPVLDPASPKFKGRSFQSQMQLHREEARCAVCHVKLEPLGNAFEMFDPIGQVRDRSSGNARLTPADTAGQFPDGPAYRDLAEFKQIMRETYADDVMRGLVAKLIHYGRGRPPSYEESPLVEQIVESARRDDYRLRSIVQKIVGSELFLH
jgi:hypothetical protein